MEKLVFESLNSFEKKKDSLSSLGVGKRKLIEDWLDKYDIRKYKINDDLTIDITESLTFCNMNLVEFPDYIQFNYAKFWFACSNTQLMSLKGCPKHVNGIFYCQNNKLTSLEYMPQKLLGIECYNNKVKFSKDYIKSLCNIKSDDSILN